MAQWNKWFDTILENSQETKKENESKLVSFLDSTTSEIKGNLFLFLDGNTKDRLSILVQKLSFIFEGVCILAEKENKHYDVKDSFWLNQKRSARTVETTLPLRKLNLNVWQQVRPSAGQELVTHLLETNWDSRYSVYLMRLTDRHHLAIVSRRARPWLRVLLDDIQIMIQRCLYHEC